MRLGARNPGMRAAAIAVAAVLTLLCPSGRPVRASAPDLAADIAFIRMIGPLTGWAVTPIREPGPNMLLHTSDGGAHWDDVTPAALSGVSPPAVLSPAVAWLDASTLLQTADGGRTWHSLGPLPMFRARGNGALYPAAGTLDFIDARNGWRLMGAASFGNEEIYVHRTTDGGATWAQVAYAGAGDERSGLPFAGTKTGMTFLDTATGWLAGYERGCGHTYLFVTHDGGRTWRPQRVPLPPRVRRWNGATLPPVFFSIRDGVLPVSLSYSVKDENCEEGRSAVVFYVTHDAGATWTATTPVQGQSLAAWSFADVTHGWLAGSHVVYRTVDGGRQWTALPIPADLADISQLDFISPQAGWAVRGSLSTLTRTPGSLLKTVDGGQTWTSAVYSISRP